MLDVEEGRGAGPVAGQGRDRGRQDRPGQALRLSVARQTGSDAGSVARQARQDLHVSGNAAPGHAPEVAHAGQPHDATDRRAGAVSGNLGAPSHQAKAIARATALLALLAGAASAQTADLNPDTVRACFAGADSVAPACVGAAANACQSGPGGSTTLGATDCLLAETGVWDELLNTTYKGARARLLQQGGTALADQLLDAQRAWIAFRDADCGLIYTIWVDGSIRTVLAADCQMRKTAQRALELRDMGNMQ